MDSNKKFLMLPVGFYFVVVWIFMGCTRNTSEEMSFVSISTPPKGSLAGKLDVAQKTFVAGYKICYAVSILGAGLKSESNSCGGTTGERTTFKAEGETLELSLPKGGGRVVDLYAYLAEEGTVCPEWNDGFQANGANYRRLFKVASAANVEMQSDVTVNLTVAFPGVLNSVAAQNNSDSCVGVASGTLKALLYNNGDFVGLTKSGGSSALTNLFTKPFLEAVVNFFEGLYNDEGLRQYGTAGNLNQDDSSAYPQYLHSFSRKPDSGVTYALTSDNQIVQLTTGISYQIPTTCPFNVTGCRLPAWVQSMSTGMSTDLFALDHGGIIYKAVGSDLVQTTTVVLPSVKQVIYY